VGKPVFRFNVNIMKTDNIHIGTCSWKYDSWQGLVYSAPKPENYLAEYSRKYSTVEVDQWFWSLFAGDKVVLPKDKVVSEYAGSVPESFRFGIKVPNSLTLTHHYKKDTGGKMIVNPHFLSYDLMEKFLGMLEPLSGKIGPLMFQFEYLNKQKMGGVGEFAEKFGAFAARLPKDFSYCLEIRNPNYLNTTYFSLIEELGLHHVFLQGYYMPPLFDVYDKWREYIRSLTVIRLMGGDRCEIEEKTGKKWDTVVIPRDVEIAKLAGMLADLQSREVETYLFVNNHFEGSAPRTLAKIAEILA